ncbi:MAG: UPF0182 family protein [cyanobacterium endosymbiont of Rhopalodia musculus]|uniref:UPF0182 family protein n=1 Tax=cyanobacterium endosymbiont of Epithemia clementina EcSB TaxID=3034674 RepID=UPI0024818300|nr:UPF0182 family protein [cyanobacterium endosymbiont of Epithemia clementina EcSB]WGT68112.1 UPF0182 family protein [cyanobacterium endosymbiont of Epithemia clementina EcSB]
MFKLSTHSIFKVLSSLFGLWLAFELLSHLVVESLWFQELGYLNSFLKRLLWQFGLFGVTTGLSLGFLLKNLYQAQYYQWHSIPESPLPQKGRHRGNSGDHTQKNYQTSFPESRSFGLSWLLTLVLFLGTLIGLMLLYYSQVAYDIWTPDLTLPNITPPLPSPFNFNSIPKLFSQISQNLWKVGVIGGLIFLTLLKRKFYLKTMAIIFSIIFGLVISGNWTRILQYFNSTPFSAIDPQFGRNISFYVFKLPFWKLLNFWLGGLFIYGFVTVSLVYLLSAKSLSQGRFPGFSRHQLRHLYLLGGLTLSIVGLRHWLNRYDLLYSPRGVVYGASYTDVHVSLPVDTTLCILVTVIAVWLLLKAIAGFGPPLPVQPLRSKNRPCFSFFTLPFVLYLIILIFGSFLTEVVQSFVVQPNELGQERPYIERSIALTRAAFNLDQIKIETLDATGTLTDEDLQDNRLTIKNIRLWDARPLLQTNRQLQQIRLYYKFPDADIDRYRIPIENECLSPNVAKQQVLIAARELDYNEVPEQAKTWVNKHLIYTHGYGFTLSLVNRVDQGGLPFYFVKNIETTSNGGELQTSNSNICNSIPIDNPRIYFGELTDTYIMTNTEVQELDYPSGQDNAYNVYDGQGGISINSAVRRLLFAEYLKDWQMLFTKNFTSQTRLLFHRDINRRIRKIAPFLHFDQDSYLVSAKVDDSNSHRLVSSSTLYWIIDAYTTSGGYPYSDPGKHNFNYIRNSVKIVIDAYNGNVQFYVVDPSDPIIKTWQQVFPDLFKPLGEMPVTLKAHVRYPKDLFNTQSERLLTYHMTDAQVFYNREDQWRIPQEIYGGEQQPIEPYYLLMRVTGKSQEFILINFFTPTSRNNLISGLFAQSDGENYGKLNLIQLPKQRVIYGPEQIEALINQDPVISQQISLWNRQGSRVIQGNLLVIPFFAEQSLLYVEPLYLEAEQNSLPTLVRVIVIYENKIVMAQNLDKALQSIFEPSQSTPETIIRSLTEGKGRTLPEELK